MKNRSISRWGIPQAPFQLYCLKQFLTVMKWIQLKEHNHEMNYKVDATLLKFFERYVDKEAQIHSPREYRCGRQLQCCDTEDPSTKTQGP